MSPYLILSVALLATIPQLASAQGKLPPCWVSRKVAWTDCEGSYTYDDWSTYTGGFKNDKRHGRGVIVYPNGQKYVGEFKFDLGTVPASIRARPATNGQASSRTTYRTAAAN